MRKFLILIIAVVFSVVVNAQPNGTYTIAIPGGWNNSQAFNSSLAAAANGHVYFTGKTGYVYHFNGAGVSMFDTTGYPLGVVNYDIDESDGKLWVGNTKGLYTYENNSWIGYTSQNSPMPASAVYCVKAVANTIYAGTDSGVVRKNINGYEVFNTGNSPIIGNIVRGIDILSNGSLVVGTQSGVSIYNGTSWANYDTTNSALKSNSIRYIKSAQNNTFWVVTAAKQDSTDYYPGYYLYKNGAFIPLSSLEDNCLYRNMPLTANPRLQCVDGNGNLIININGNLKKYIHPDNGVINTAILNPSISAGLICKSGEYSNFGFDCFVSGASFKILLDTCFTSQYVIDSLKAVDGREVIDINNIKATIRSQGDLFTNYDKISENQSPKTACANTVQASALWLGGIDNGGNLHGAAMTYRQTGVDYWPGPLDTVNVACVNDAQQYNKIWKINKSMIQDFQQNYQNGPAYINPDILSWPGNGTGNMAKRLAPFVDLNSNGIYEPLLGEYPEIEGDEMLYWIFNDKCNVHSETGCSPLGVEIHGKAYAYVCDDIDPNSADYALNNTVFYSYAIYNRSTNNYRDFYISWWHDVDLGNYMDDYVGCDIDRNAGFVYNGDNYDQGIYGYGLNPPMQSYVQLQGPIAPANDGIDNNHNGVIDEQYEQILFTNFVYYNNDFSITGNPENCQHIYNYMRSRWKDNTPMVYGGTNGYGSGTPTNYTFPTPPYSNGEPGDTLPPWNEVLSGNTPGDRRFIMSCGPTELEPGGVINVVFASVFSHYNSAPNGANTSLALNNSYVDKVTDWFNSQNYPSCYNPTSVVETTGGIGKLNVYPNPATNMVTINIGGKSDALDYCVTDMAGKTVVCGKGNTINLGGFANGMYLLYAQNNDGVFYTKLIKQ